MTDQEPIVNSDVIQSTLSEAKALARDQISAAWQLQVEKIQDLLAGGWRDQIGRVLDERFEEIEQSLAPKLNAAILGREIDAQRTLAAREDELNAIRAERDALQASLTEKEAAWHGERETLESQWKNSLAAREQEFERRLNDEIDATTDRVRASVEDAAHHAVHEASLAARRAACRETSEQLNQFARRLVGAENQEQWREALLDGASTQAGRVMLFSVASGKATLDAQRGFDGGSGLEIPLAESSALTTAVSTKDTVVTVRTSSEFGERIADLAPETKGAKAYLFPVRSRDEVCAVLYAEPSEEALEVSSLELLASVAGLSQAARTSLPANPAKAAAAVTNSSGEGLATLMNSLTREEQDLHLRAQRFARVQVAEMRLYKSNLVKEGRTRQNIYNSLREEIDLSREAFRTQFMKAGPSMVDYFHLELVHTLANDDPSLLGQEYPGPLVPAGA